MTFFCAKCQKRHDVKDISADMWSICKEGLKESIKPVLRPLIDSLDVTDEVKEDVNGLYNDLFRFIHTTEPRIRALDGSISGARINAFFPLSRNTLRQLTNAAMRSVQGEGGTVSGTYQIHLGTLLHLYARWDEANYSINCIPPKWYNEVLFRQDLLAFFAPNGVLDKVTDTENVPFARQVRNADDGRTQEQMLGFTHICPHCGRVLSRAAGAAQEIVVALAGAPRAGKTACMVAMLSSLLKGNCPGVRIIPMAHDEKWYNLSKEIDFYDRCQKVEKTPDKISDVPAHSILVELNDKRRTRRVLTIVDMPGEFWQGSGGLTPEFFRQYAGIYENIDCIWFVISKATVCLSHVGNIPAVVQDELLSQASEEVQIIKNASAQNLSVNLGELRSQLHKPMPPVMVIVSKPDYSVSELDAEKTAAYKVFPSNPFDIAGANAEELSRTLKTDAQRLYGVSQYPLYEHAANVRSFIKDSYEPFLMAIESNCPDRFYTALAPYGRPAFERDDSSSEMPTPYHELVPFIWTLAIQAGIQVYQDCRWLKMNWMGRQVSEEHTRELVDFTYLQRNLPVPKKNPTPVEDRNSVYATISNNLLMNGGKYIAETVIHHERQ